MSGILRTFSKINTVFVTNILSSVGADLIVLQVRRKGFFIIKVDSESDAVKAMTSKDSLFVVTTAQYPTGMTQKAVWVGNDILHGKKPKSPNILIPVTPGHARQC
jgi:ribose transport system substrate-binding protein